jgi:hypothetical protein
LTFTTVTDLYYGDLEKLEIDKAAFSARDPAAY